MHHVVLSTCDLVQWFFWTGVCCSVAFSRRGLDTVLRGLFLSRVAAHDQHLVLLASPRGEKCVLGSIWVWEFFKYAHSHIFMLEKVN